MLDKPFGHRRVQVDGVAVERGAVYHGGALLATSGGTSTVSVYDGIDTQGELIDYFRATASDRDVHVFECGVAVREGLSIDVGSYSDIFVLYYDPPEPGKQ